MTNSAAASAALTVRGTGVGWLPRSSLIGPGLPDTMGTHPLFCGVPGVGRARATAPLQCEHHPLAGVTIGHILRLAAGLRAL